MEEKRLQNKKEKKLTHFDEEGNAIMVDLTGKEETSRVAAAKGIIEVNSEIIRQIKENSLQKGDVLGVARIAGIMAAKKTSDVIPLCHPLLLSKVTIDFEIMEEKSEITALCTVKTEGKTGVEMEALTGVSTALLTVYDMCKAVDKGMVLKEIHLCEKHGGKSGDFYFET